KLKSGPCNAQAERLHHHERRDQGLDPQPRPQMLDQDRIVEPVKNSFPVHHASSFEPTLRKSSSRLSLRRSNEATRTPRCTRVVSRLLAASESPWNRNSYEWFLCSTGPARSRGLTIDRKISGSPSTSTEISESPMIRRLTSSMR